MDDLVQFLRDRYDEDERQANAATTYAAATWFIETSGIVTTGPDDDVYTDDREVAEHMARHDPARVLREVEAKRQIVDHVAYELDDSGADNPWWYADRLTPILKSLALPYADHLDYRDTWRP